MAWNRQKNGRHIYHEQVDSVLLLGGKTIAPGSTIGFMVPWAVDGFTAATLILPFSCANVAWDFELFVRPLGSESVAGAEVKFWADIGDQDISVTGSVAVTGGGDSKLFVTFFDGPLPGNLWLKDPSGIVTSESNVLNPVAFTHASNLLFTLLVNSGGDTVDIGDNPSIILKG